MDQHYGIKKITTDNLLSPDTLGMEVNINRDEWNTFAVDFLRPCLVESVPSVTIKLFEVARGAMIYGLYFYPLFTLGTEQLYRVAESALREKCKELKVDHINRMGFKNLLDKLIKQEVIPRNRERIWDTFRQLRNSSSHPEETTILFPSIALNVLNSIVDQINLLYDD